AGPAPTADETRALDLADGVGAKRAAPSVARARLATPPRCREGLGRAWACRVGRPRWPESTRRPRTGASAVARAARGTRTRRTAARRARALMTMLLPWSCGLPRVGSRHVASPTHLPATPGAGRIRARNRGRQNC